LLRPYLRVTDFEGTLYPCPRIRSGYCPRRIVDYGDGEYAALCRDPHEICERVVLTRRDVLMHALDVASFSQMLAEPLGISWQRPVERDDGTWAIGLSARRDSKSEPAFLIILPEAERFTSVLQRLLLNIAGPFVVVAPTARHRSTEVQEMLQRRGVLFLALEECLEIGDDGRLASVEIDDPASALRPTPPADRKRVVKEFRARNGCMVRDIQEAAGVDGRDYYRWLEGKLPDHYSICICIERILKRGLLRQDGQETGS
jgi:hypothetical protein